MYVISYDISQDKRRSKVSKTLEGYGQRVQYSVFECRITSSQMEELYQKLMVLMQGEEEGNIRVYSICQRCENKLRTIGLKTYSMTLEEENLFII